jgi:hypothetical protein
MTCRRDRLPKGIPNCYFHKVATAPGDTKARVARFNNPITVVKHVSLAPHAGPVPTDRENFNPTTPPIKYTKVHVTFQSTSSCNMTTVNALNKNSLFVVQKERDSGKQKRKWVIKMNDAPQLYLATYGRIDTQKVSLVLLQLEVLAFSTESWTFAGSRDCIQYVQGMRQRATCKSIIWN